ncbi:MAG: tRNA threonylcarbamoyladenosine dehydratase [Clostridia bacterium]|nr:tRNA threonylcarbamoyladenosine dehydratase [Clostridia bacterium]
MIDQFSRSEIIYGKDAMEKLRTSSVAVFGVGGVGGHAAEALVRAGIGRLDIVDNDKVSLTNLNRQIIALHSTIGEYKVYAAKKRFLDISPDVDIRTHNVFYTPETAGIFDFSEYDYIIDAIDSVTGKIELVMQANKNGTPIISSMGAGNKVHPEMFEVADIYKTSVCPLARVMRTELRKRGIKRLKVVYSKETPVKPGESGEDKGTRRVLPGSASFVPGVAGLIIAGEVVNDLVRM